MNNFMEVVKKYKVTLAMILAFFVLTATLEYLQGRLLICSCGVVKLWAGNIWSADNSQHIFDPYSFTHVLHGFLFFGLTFALASKIKTEGRLVIAVALESAWELLENSAYVINKYRETTLALGYQGDTVINSMSDILMCAVGFIIVKHIGVKKSLIVFVVVELVLLFWIRDNLTLNIVMLIYPVEAIKQWQMFR